MTARYITTPIYYLNGRPHLGHVYTTLAADVLARYWRMTGAEVKFLTGTDEHGQKIAQAADAAGVEPQAWVDQLAEVFREVSVRINASPDDFIRTTEPRHFACAQALWKKLEEKGQIYLGSYAGWYAVRDEAYYDESEIVDGKAPTGAPVEWLEQESYFFKLSDWQEPLLAFYEANPEAIGPNSRRNEVLSFIKGGLRDLSVSRSNFTWGVPVPGNPQHVMYVWIEALSNYLTAIGYPDEKGTDFQTFWPESIHLLGKDIIRFHAVYWPAFLMAADLMPPKRIFAHGWLTNGGEKMSKSLGNVLDPFALIDTYGVDPLRYFLMREVPFGQDGTYSEEAITNRINSDLANDFGNLCQRVLSFVHKNAGAVVPTPGEWNEADRKMLGMCTHLKEVCREAIENQAIHQYAEHIWVVIREANRYVDEQAPWSLRKSEDPADHARMHTILYVLMEVIRHGALYTTPLMPESSAKILAQLSRTEQTFADLDQALMPGTSLPQPIPVFPRIEKE